jgi:hypothetical protein
MYGRLMYKLTGIGKLDLSGSTSMVVELSSLAQQFREVCRDEASDRVPGVICGTGVHDVEEADTRQRKRHELSFVARNAYTLKESDSPSSMHGTTMGGNSYIFPCKGAKLGHRLVLVEQRNRACCP